MISSTKLTEIISLVTPVAAPVAPATVILMQLRESMISIGVDASVSFWLALLSAAAMEGAGYGMFVLAFRAYRQHETIIVRIAAFCTAVYFGLVMLGLLTAHNAVPLISTVLISLLAYVGNGMGIYLDQRGEQTTRDNNQAAQAALERQQAESQAAALELQRAETQAAIERQRAEAQALALDAQTRLERARARSARLTGNLPQPPSQPGNIPETSTQTAQSDGNLPETYRTYRDWRSIPQYDRQLIASMSPKQIASTFNVSDRTARNWLNNAKKD